MGIQTPTIGLMTLPYYLEIMGLLDLIAHITITYRYKIHVPLVEFCVGGNPQILGRTFMQGTKNQLFQPTGDLLGFKMTFSRC